MSNQLSGATRLFPIIGDPVKYAESPVRLTRTFGERSHNGVCIPMQVPAGGLDIVMAGLEATLNVDGILVTMPHKHAAFAHCTTSSERARILGVVSVIRRNPDGTWHGDMLDGLAFVGHRPPRPARRPRRETGGYRTAGPDRLRPGVQCDADGHGDGDPLPVDAGLLTSSMFAGDVIAGHGVTLFIEAAQVAGGKTANGGHMVEAVQDLMADFMLGK
jgi:shikimate dehydrogenase